MSETFRIESGKDWHKVDIQPSNDDLKIGCLQRIADACELMVKAKERLERDIQYLRKENKRLQLSNDRYWRAICAYKGILKKKNKH